MILLDRYQLIKGYGQHTISVGFGSYGQVKLAIDKKTGQKVAVKIVHKLAQNQVVFHRQLYHPNIIQLLGHCIDAQRQITYMVLQYADGGTLFDKIRNEKINKKYIKSYFRDVCQAVAYLHQNQIMHRDIKPQNILLTTKGKAKLCDFGFAAILGERKTLCGTYEYMSPEMVQNRPYDYKIDIWALGILLFQLIAGKAPFKGNSPEEVLDQMKTKIFFNERFSTQEVNLIKSILRVTPIKRPTIKQILQHPYFTQQDTASTKQSETELTSKLNSLTSNLVSKPQQNSYPTTYIPKLKQPLKSDKPVHSQKFAQCQVQPQQKAQKMQKFQKFQKIPQKPHYQSSQPQYPHRQPFMPQSVSQPPIGIPQAPISQGSQQIYSFSQQNQYNGKIPISSFAMHKGGTGNTNTNTNNNSNALNSSFSHVPSMGYRKS